VRVVSLVPSLTDTVAALGAADRLVGVTRYCVRGAPAHAELVGGTKNPDIEAIVALRPDLVLANTEENRPADLNKLRAAGLSVHETYPKTVRQAAEVVTGVAALLGRGDTAGPIVAEIDAALVGAEAAAPAVRVMALTLVWRKPWMGLGPDTYADDLLWRCGFGNVLSGFGEPYPRLDPSFVLGADVVLLPSEPYAFGESDLDAVRDLAGDVPARFVDGGLLTWHGPRSAEALGVFSRLANELAT
jgi:ABC-type Fe3+-hydroxamate transport system substrate-binding protein